MNYTDSFSAELPAIANSDLHYLVRQGAEYIMNEGYLSVSKFMETCSVFELTVISQWLEQMPKDVMNSDDPSYAVRNAMALGIVLILGEGEPQISLKSIMTACIHLHEYTVFELELRNLNLLEPLEIARKYYTVLER